MRGIHARTPQAKFVVNVNALHGPSIVALQPMAADGRRHLHLEKVSATHTQDAHVDRTILKTVPRIRSRGL